MTGRAADTAAGGALPLLASGQFTPEYFSQGDAGKGAARPRREHGE